jgi:ABC-type multidrug transport system fused ATPase/permease subunit
MLFPVKTFFSAINSTQTARLAFDRIESVWNLKHVKTSDSTDYGGEGVRVAHALSDYGCKDQGDGHVNDDDDRSQKENDNGVACEMGLRQYFDDRNVPHVTVREACFPLLRVFPALQKVPTEGGDIKSEVCFAATNLSLKAGEHCGVYGRVGCGKTTFLRIILGEVTPLTGSVTRSGKLAFCSQESFLLCATVKENITFGLPYDEEWFKKVIELCELQLDLQRLDKAENTVVGENGVKLSGGQKQRVCLARCAYSRPDLVILDDPFSALDTDVREKIWKNLVGQLWSKKTLIIATNDESKKPCLDTIIEISNMAVKSIKKQHEKYCPEQDKGQVSKIPVSALMKTPFLAQSPSVVTDVRIERAAEAKRLLSVDADCHNALQLEVPSNISESHGISRSSSPSRAHSAKSQQPREVLNQEIQSTSRYKIELSENKNMEQLALSRGSKIVAANSREKSPSARKPESNHLHNDESLRESHLERDQNNFFTQRPLIIMPIDAVALEGTVHGDRLKLSMLEKTQILPPSKKSRIDKTIISKQSYLQPPMLGNSRPPSRSSFTASKFRLVETFNLASLEERAAKILPIFLTISQHKSDSPVQFEEMNISIDPPTESPLAANISLTPCKTSESLVKYPGFALCIILLLFWLLFTATRQFFDYWLGNWASATAGSSTKLSPQVYPWLSLVLLCFAILLMVARSLLYSFLSLKSTLKLHASLISSLICKSLTYFDRTPVGTATNHATKDVSVVDNQLLMNLLWMLTNIMQFSAFVVVATAAVPFLLVLFLISVLAAIHLVRRYTTAALKLRKLSIQTAAPFLQGILELFQGLETMRAFKKQEYIFSRFMKHLNTHNNSVQHELFARQWINVRMELLISILVGLVAFSVAIVASVEE